MSAAVGAPLVSVHGASVRYGPTIALADVDLDIHAGEVHAVVGENGAGKSTLLRAVAGMLVPDTGTVTLRDDAQLAWVPQETVLPLDLSVSQWLFLGREIRSRFGCLDARAMQVEAARALEELGCAARPDDRLGTLSLPQRKQCQLARVLVHGGNVLLLDEPTAVLGDRETQRLFALLRMLQQRGCGVLYVSHRLEEVRSVADRITVLRDGRRVSTDAMAAVDTPMLVRRMVGRDLAVRSPRRHAPGAPVLHIVDVTAGPVHDLSLTVCRGEIVGLAGLVGAGRSALLEAVAGLRPLRAGRIDCRARVAFVPEDRGSKGLVSGLGLRDNLFLPSETWFIRRRRERRAAQRWIERLRIRTASTECAIDTLSGGNQQKLLLARALRHDPELLLLDEPTAGVDIGAKAEIHQLICQLAAGAAILLASSELPELLALCDRIIALRAGAVVGIVSAATASEADLAGLITGAAA